VQVKDDKQLNPKLPIKPDLGYDWLQSFEWRMERYPDRRLFMEQRKFWRGCHRNHDTADMVRASIYFICGRFDPFAWAVDPDRRSDIYEACLLHDAKKPPAASVVILGSPGSAGIVEGRVRLLAYPDEGMNLQEGEILVTRQTDVSWTTLFPRAAAVITDIGALLSHAAIVARKLGIPAVVGCGDATIRLKNGSRVHVDGGKGTVEILPAENPPFHIRYAAAADNMLLAELGAQTFTDSFGPDNTPENMRAYLEASFSPEIQQRELADAAARFLIIERGAEAVGYARLNFGPAPAAVVAQKPMEIVRFYARKEWIGKEVGAQLMKACLREAEDAGCDVVWLDVWEHNPRAIAFYRKWGFDKVGDQVFQLGDDVQNDWLMSRVVS
jgi:phosphohistidine swiveling domain-containing protein/GNAT superfamily N-acetyltransferase